MDEDLLSQLTSAQSDEAREWIVLEATINKLPPILQKAVWAAAIVHWFDHDFLCYLLSNQRRISKSNFQKLISLPFVELFPGRGYNIHERSRGLLLNRMWENNQKQYFRLNQRAAEYCSKQDATDYVWAQQTIYHMILCTPSKGIGLLLGYAVDAFNVLNVSRLEGLILLLLRDLEEGRVEESASRILILFQGMVDLFRGRYKEVITNLEKVSLIQADHFHPSVQLFIATMYDLLGDEERADHGYRKALQAILEKDESVDLPKSQQIRIQGVIHSALENYDQALEFLKMALEIERQEGNVIPESQILTDIGELYLKKQEYEKAIQAYQEAIAKCQAIGNQFLCACSRIALGKIYIEQDQYELARVELEQALEFLTNSEKSVRLLDCLVTLARLYVYSNKDFEKAKRNIEYGIQLSEEFHNDDQLIMLTLLYAIIHSKEENNELAQKTMNQLYERIAKVSDERIKAKWLKLLSDILRDQEKEL